MQPLGNRVFLILLGIFIGNKILEFSGIFVPIVTSYLDDILALPILLTLILIAHRIFRVKTERYVLPLFHVLVAVIVIGIIHEFVFPVIFSHSTSDWYDLLAYSGGGVIFQRRINIF